MDELSPAVRALNRALAADPHAITALFCNRVPCNESLAGDPTVIVAGNPHSGFGFNVGVLGLLNGVLAEMGAPTVALTFAKEPDARGRGPIVGFCDYRPPDGAP